MNEIKNAKIKSTMLGYEDHGIFTCSLWLDYGGSSQCFGGYGFDFYDKELKMRTGTAYGLNFIIGILKTLEIRKWEDLIGQNIRVEAEDNSVIRIGHFLKNIWFDPKEVKGSSGE